MSNITDKRLALAFALLTGVTLLSWWLGAGQAVLNAGITFAVILMAAVKVRVIVWEFMELRHAPARIQRGADIYLGTITGLLLLVYAAGARLQF